MNKKLASLVLIILFLLLPLSTASAQNEPDDAYIRGILQERVEKSKRNVGIVVGLISNKGTRIISYGKPALNSNAELNGDTIFEIGSVTKVFTSILLADMALRGEVSLNDPAAKYLPKLVKVPTRNGKEITLLDLATHTSGLPRLPGNMKPKDPNNPYADYTVEQMYEFLSGYQLTRDIGEKYEYSNFGAGLLGHILSLRAGTDYETLVIKRICKPLGMDSTRAKLTPQMQARLATGHDDGGRPVMNWDLPTLAGAGALRSSTNDMLKFLAANMGLSKSSLLPAMQKSHAMQRSTDVPEISIGLGWHILNKFGTEIVWHNGGTAGYHSFIGFDKKKGLGVVVLSNSVTDTDDIGLHLLDSKYPLAKYEPRRERKAIKVDPKILEAYVGQYQLAPTIIINVTREGDKLYAQAADQPGIELLAESETEFFTTVVDAQLTFVKNEKGQVTGLILHRDGQNIPAKKIK
ncbi:MAG TPA: serine hydrolase [Pyrinomonadaceae bacterium]|jgi:CubicO group peptidase (beta-lactamase class C family)